jgi:polyferredoxin
MTSRRSRTLKRLRIVSQGLFFGLFVYVFTRSLDPFHPAENPFLRFDFLIFLTHLRFQLRLVLPMAGIILLTLAVGRYFCGWVCPLGTLIDLADLFLSPVRKRNPFTGWRKAFGRIFAASPPSWFILGASLAAMFFTLPVLQFFHPNVWIVRIFSLSAPGIAFGCLLLLFAIFARRFWCAYLCPLGAFYGLLGKLSLFRLGIAECSRCGRCRSCPMDAADYEKKQIVDHQCILCFDFEEHCPAEGFRFGLRRRPAQPAKKISKVAPVSGGHDESRRRFLRRGAVLLGGLGLGSILPAFARTTRTPLLRPPGVVNEKSFVGRCLRCLQCVRSCPNKIIKTTGIGTILELEAGLDSLFTPHIEFNEFGCDYHCQVCQRVCPNYAIPLQTLEEKQKTKIGLASIDRRLCVVYALNTNCLVCEEFCPIPEKAIKVVDKTIIVNGEPLLLRYPVVSPLCIGCGKCEGNCPVEQKAIRVHKT